MSTDNTTEQVIEQDTAHVAERPERNSEPALGELAWADPTTLVIGLNTRTEARLDPHFCRDIAERGVREPITVRRDAEGRLVVRKGQRRTLAAVKAKLAQVRVLIEDATVASEDDAAGQIDRIVDQWGENFHRKAITEAEEAEAHQQLLDLGLSAAQVARRTHTPAARVRALHAVNASSMARAALQGVGGPTLLLDQAAVVAEFDDGSEGADEAVERLLEAAENDPDQFGHVAQRLRDARAERRLIAEHTAALAGEGVRVLDDDQAADATMLHRLRPTADDPSGTALHAEDHTGCPGHGVHLTIRWDWQARANTLRTEVYCTQTERHAPRYDAPAAVGGAGVGAGGGDVDEEEAKERKRAERRRVITNNKAWESATAHRQQWLTELLARKKAPANTAAFIAGTLAAGSHDARRAMEGGQATACALLKLPEPKPYWAGGSKELIEAARTATTTRATQVSLAVLLGAYEDGTSRDSWRNPTSENRTYFTALREWGYPLSDVEQLVLDPEADHAPDGAEESTDQAGDPEGEEPEPGDEAGGAQEEGWPATA